MYYLVVMQYHNACTIVLFYSSSCNYLSFPAGYGGYGMPQQQPAPGYGAPPAGYGPPGAFGGAPMPGYGAPMGKDQNKTQSYIHE